MTRSILIRRMLPSTAPEIAAISGITNQYALRLLNQMKHNTSDGKMIRRTNPRECAYEGRERRGSVYLGGKLSEALLINASSVLSEHIEQACVISWWASYSRTKGIDERLLFAIPNAQKFASKAKNVHAAIAHVSMRRDCVMACRI